MLDSTTKECRTCGNEYPATPEYFRRYAKMKDGLVIHCKRCQCKKVPRNPAPIEVGIPGALGLPLTKGHIAIIDEIDADLGAFRWKANVIKGRAYAARYARTDGKDTLVYLHRLILERKLGRLLDAGELGDHEDNDPTNNRRCNLRLADYSKNGANRKISSNNQCGYKGVVWKEGSWCAVIRVKGENTVVYGFKTPEEAHAKYREMAQELFGEYARFE